MQGMTMAGMSGMPVGDVLPELVLLGGAVVVLVFALFAPRRRQACAALLALVTLTATAAVTAPLLAGVQHLTFQNT
ncbi:MAG TPA: hypothetical protein VF488_02375 [Gemmatimonadaceae bacterium]